MTTPYREFAVDKSSRPVVVGASFEVRAEGRVLQVDATPKLRLLTSVAHVDLKQIQSFRSSCSQIEDLAYGNL